MTEERQRNLCESLKRLGYGRNRQVRLYGADYDLTSDPIVVADRLVVVDAIERRSGQSTRIRIPLTILKAARQNLSG
ncbi:MAG TPA: hypothetical protein VMI10_08245 [Terriglobales bacterium]|jgi:hypothetical protein|nr:hypothetical protein [Terriglobales bacterium]HXJ86827.1 hypothetical protein [Candidatus Binatia bacterium]